MTRTGGRSGAPARSSDLYSGNLCRCAARPNILAAIKHARDADEEP
jgi:aerobic-type carbon monoxide dehydrogenase small subunit (CoxS/CutS family)